MMVAVASFSSIISNTVTTAAFLPVACGAAHRAKVPKSKVLLPLAYASMLGGMIFLYGTSTNLVVSAALQRMGMPGIGVAELAGDAVGPLGEREELDLSLDVHAFGGDVLGEEALGFILRDHEREAVRAFVGAHHEVHHGLRIGVDGAAVDF